MVIARRTVVSLGFAQLISWGVSYYLIGGFGEAIGADLGFGRDLTYGGFSAALLAMGLCSPLAGRLIDRYGGRRVMIAGAVLTAAGCIALAFCHGVALYYAAWICLGIAMRLTLYDAGFAALARIGGPQARGPISQITLLGGLASTVFWPLGDLIASYVGWRGAVIAYAGFALCTVPLYLTIPEGRYDDAAAPAGSVPAHRPLADGPRDRVLAGSLYAVIAVLTNFLNAGMSSHMIAILAGLGVAATTSVWIATLRGVGQSLSRFGEILFGRRIDPLALNLGACALLPLCFVAGLFSGQYSAAALAFAFVYGATNGIVTITRGTLPLVLFDHRVYGTLVGRLLAPSFILSATAPLIYATTIMRFGERGALVLSFIAAAIALAAAAVLAWRYRR
jgi:predicted MFS family arabinose efflux permease